LFGTDFTISKELNGSTINYLQSRKIDEKFYHYFRSLEENDELIMMPLFYNKDFIFGYQVRFITKKQYRTSLYTEKLPKIWGLDRLDNSSTDKDSKIYVFEGIFDALSVDLKSIAVLGSDFSKTIEHNKSRFVMCFDNDETGIKKAIKYSEMGYSVLVHPKSFKYKDMNSALVDGWRLEDTTSYVLENIMSPKMANFKLRMM